MIGLIMWSCSNNVLTRVLLLSRVCACERVKSFVSMRSHAHFLWWRVQHRVTMPRYVLQANFHDDTFSPEKISSKFRVTVSTQVLGKETSSASCLFTWHVPTRRLSRLLLLCWLRILMVRLHEWAGLWRVVILGVFVLLDCVCGGCGC